MCRAAYKRMSSVHLALTTAQLTLVTRILLSLCSCTTEKSNGSGKGQCRGGSPGPPLRAPPRRARRVGGVHGRRPWRVELQHRRVDQGQALPRRRRARLQVQPVGAQRGAGDRGGVQVVQRAAGRQDAQVRQRPRHAEARHQLLHLHLPGALPVRHEDRHQRRLIGRVHWPAATAARARVQAPSPTYFFLLCEVF